MKRTVCFFFLAALAIYCNLAQADTIEKGADAMQLTSPSFENNTLMPQKFTCDGEDINPALVIKDIPEKTQSLALIVDDPDAPGRTWVHWVVYNIPIVSRIEENSIPGKQGDNSFGRKDFGGPCPPSGTHRYFFKLYALDKKLEAKEALNKQALGKLMQAHILAKAELLGLYKRK